MRQWSLGQWESIRMNARLLLAAFVVPLIAPAPAHAWGKTGHRVVARLADGQLSGLARAQVNLLLGSETLDEAATWPDDMKSDPSDFWQKTASPWHYVTLDGTAYAKAPPEGDAVEALGRFSATLKDPKASLADKQLALRFIVHLVADLHQPLHAGKCCDRGGNDVKVEWFGRETNLHSVWDSALVDDTSLSFTELSDRLARNTSAGDVVAWWSIDPRQWVGESAALRDGLYPPATADGTPAKLGYAYAYRYTPVVSRRLSQAGVRLAAYLNAIYAEPKPTPAGRPAE